MNGLKIIVEMNIQQKLWQVYKENLLWHAVRKRQLKVKILTVTVPKLVISTQQPEFKIAIIHFLPVEVTIVKHLIKHKQYYKHLTWIHTGTSHDSRSTPYHGLTIWRYGPLVGCRWLRLGLRFYPLNWTIVAVDGLPQKPYISCKQPENS